MFTGIIQEIGTAILVDSVLQVTLKNPLVGVKQGDSISINGICLTVVNIEGNKLEFFVMEETLRVSTLGFSKDTKFPVNIERSVRQNETMDGHLVLGHIHEVGQVTNIQDNKDGSKDIWFKIKDEKSVRYKDGIAIDGVSLTIAEVKGNTFRVSLIPYTLTHTILGEYVVNDKVNIEYNGNQRTGLKRDNHKVTNEKDLNSTDETDGLRPHISSQDEVYMSLALKESKKGRTTAPPNPWVGAIIVHSGKVIGKGYHVKPGSPHAEFNAVIDAIELGYQELLSESTIYITLEPCHNFEGKRTPACDQLLLKHKFKRVVIGIPDPDPNVTGLGIKTLRDAGIETTVGILEDKIKKSLRSYIYHRIHKRPYLVIKIALSIDGYPCLQNGDSKWITGDEARNHAHKIRSQSQAILVGTNTVLNDDPNLNVRTKTSEGFKQPLRIVIDKLGKIIEGNVINPGTWIDGPAGDGDQGTGGTLMIIGDKVDPDTLKVWESRKVEYTRVPFVHGKLDLDALLDYLGKRGILQLLVEGGPYLHTEFMRYEYQELHVYHGNLIMGGNGKRWIDIPYTRLADIQRLKLIKSKAIGNDTFSKYLIQSTRESSIKKAVLELQKGRSVILMDNEDRENEADLIIGAQFMTPEITNFFIRNSTGIICVPMEEKRAKRLRLPKMVKNNEDPNGTPFTVSCDHKETKTGVSAKDRSLTITKLADDSVLPSDFSRPGHLYPLIAAKGGLFERQGHTEGSIELCKLAGIKPVAAIAELMNPDGTMMNYDNALEFSKKNSVMIVTMKELIEYLQVNHNKTRPISSCELELNNNDLPSEGPTDLGRDGHPKGEPKDKVHDVRSKDGRWDLICYSSGIPNHPHRVLIKGDLYSTQENTREPKANPLYDPPNQSVLLRIHSECFTGDVLGSLMCDCGDQLKNAMKLINEKGTGIIIFPAEHEGRGIGLHNKVLAYRMMKNSNYTIDTYAANRKLGLPEDNRNYEAVIDILDDLGVTKVDLLTENLEKIEVLKDRINQVIPLKCKPNPHNRGYLAVKEEKNKLQSKISYVNNNMNLLKVPDNFKIGIISTIWNGDIINPFLEDVYKELHTLGINSESIKKYEVPGSFEIPYMAKQLIKKRELGVILCVGSIIKGDTAHFEYISGSVINGLMSLQLEDDFPIINGILNCYTKEQAIERFLPENGLAQSLVLSAVRMGGKL